MGMLSSVCLVLAGCATRSALPETATVGATAGPFAEVLGRIPHLWVSGGLVVSEVVLSPSPVVSDRSVEAWHVALPPQAEAERRSVAQRYGVPVVTASEIARCRPDFQPADRPSWCQQFPVTIATFGLPRRGGAFMQGTVAGDSASLRRDEYTTMRLILTSVSSLPFKRELVADVVARQAGNRWEIVDFVALLSVD